MTREGLAVQGGYLFEWAGWFVDPGFRCALSGLRDYINRTREPRLGVWLGWSVS